MLVEIFQEAKDAHHKVGHEALPVKILLTANSPEMFEGLGPGQIIIIEFNKIISVLGNRPQILQKQQWKFCNQLLKHMRRFKT